MRLYVGMIQRVNCRVPVGVKLSNDRDICYEATALEEVLPTVEGTRKLRWDW